MTVHDTPMLEIAPPLEHSLRRASGPPNVLCDDVDRLAVELPEHPQRGAADVGPGRAQRLRKKRELTTLNRPPRTKIAPPPPSSVSSPVELPSTKVRFCTVSAGGPGPGSATSSRPGPGRTCSCRGSAARPPSSVPGRRRRCTTSGWSLKTFAVAAIVIVTGLGPQSNVMMPPGRRRSTTACRGAARRGAGADDVVRVGRVDGAGLGRDGALPSGLPGDGRWRDDRGQVHRPGQEGGHLAAGDRRIRAELPVPAAGGDASGGEPIDVRGERAPRRDVAERRAAGGGQMEAADEEGRHLATGHRVVRAEPGVRWRVAALGDTRGRELVDGDPVGAGGIREAEPPVAVSPSARTRKAAIWPRVTSSRGQNRSLSGASQPLVMPFAAMASMAPSNVEPLSSMNVPPGGRAAATDDGAPEEPHQQVGSRNARRGPTSAEGQPSPATRSGQWAASTGTAASHDWCTAGRRWTWVARRDGFDIAMSARGGGCVLARRLAEPGRPQHPVARGRAGPPRTCPPSCATGGGSRPCRMGLPVGADVGGRQKLRRGRLLGGTSWLTRFAVRGAAAGFDAWAAAAIRLGV